jgi:hypothetical protein
MEHWNMEIRKDHKLQPFLSKLLRKLFGPRKDELDGTDLLYTEEPSVVCEYVFSGHAAEMR